MVPGDHEAIVVLSLDEKPDKEPEIVKEFGLADRISKHPQAPG
jgi:hypothetical protein